jgi:hypothetical protein
MAKNNVQILIAVDLYPSLNVAELKETLPAEREGLQTLRLTEFGAPVLAPPPDDNPIDWLAIGRAVEKLVAQVREIQRAQPNPTIVFVGGRGPLAVFTHLGYALSKFGGRQVVLNPSTTGGAWEHFPMGAEPLEGSPPLDLEVGVPGQEVTRQGRVGIYIDTSGRIASEQIFEDFIAEEGDSVAGVVQLRSSTRLQVTAQNISPLILQVTQFLSHAPACFRRRAGLALFIGAPAQVAFAVGRAINPTVVGKDIWLTEYRAPRYQRVYSLPFAAGARPEIPRGPDADLARRKVNDAMLAGIADLKKYLKPEHLPEDVLGEADRKKFVARLGELGSTDQAKEDDAFELRVIEGHYTLGVGILEALRRSNAIDPKAFAQLLLLHELLHDGQGLRSTNHFAVGRAGFVLEQVDYSADVFAIRTLMKMTLDIDGPRALDEAGARLRYWLEMALHGISAFDIMEHGPKIERLTERRLRRYLTWHMQLARAATVRRASQIDEMLRPALTLELAPLAGRLDTERYEKEVTRALPDAELFCAIGGKLIREAQQQGFNPGALVDAVKTYSSDPLQAAMKFVVDKHRAELAPWSE